jgi:ribosomal-protein-alanine N-acetyltransferase
MFASAPPRARPVQLDQLDRTLVTARLRLRPLDDRDVDDLWPYVSDPELPRMMTWTAHADRQETLAYIRSKHDEVSRGGGFTWAIEHAGHACGTINLHDLSFELRAWRVDQAEIGYWIGRPLQGKGLVTEAATAVLEFGFTALGLHKIKVGCLVENVASRRVIEKLGFRSVGRLEDEVWRDGRWWSMLRYELLHAEWGDISTTARVTRPQPT